MSRNYDRSADKERELRDWFREEGWYSERVAGSGSHGDDACDVIAIGERVYFFEVKYIDPDSDGDNVNVRGDSEQLRNIREIVSSGQSIRKCMSGHKRDRECFFAIRFKGDRMWYYAPWSTKVIHVEEEYDPLRGLM